MNASLMTTPRPPDQTSGLKASRRVLFIGESVCLAHVGRPALLARWAQEAGFEVGFACGPAFDHAARGEGLRPMPLQTIRLNTLYERLDRGQFFYSPEDLDAYVESERKLIRDWKPDLVVGDFRLTLPVSTHLENVPMLSLINAHWSPAHPCQMPAPRAGLFKHLPSRLRNQIFSRIRPFVFRYFARSLDALRRRNGLSPLDDMRRLYTAGNSCAYLDIPQFMPLPEIPRGHFYLGPLTWKPEGAHPPDLSSLPPGRPLAYVSMGSSGDERVIPAVLEALEAEGFNAVLSGASPEWATQWAQTHPTFQDRMVSARLLDPDEALTTASVCICHGGSGTVYQSLAKGVPLLCLPRNPDQGLIAQALEACGAGVSLNPEDATPTRIGNILHTHFHKDSPLTEQANLLAQNVSTWNTKQRWLQWLEAFFGTTKTEIGEATAKKPGHAVSLSPAIAQ